MISQPGWGVRRPPVIGGQARPVGRRYDHRAGLAGQRPAASTAVDDIEYVVHTRYVTRIRVTAKARKRIGNRRNMMVALRHAGNPLLIDDNRAYLIGIDSRGVRFEMILVADDRDADTWILIHALPTHYRRNW